MKLFKSKKEIVVTKEPVEPEVKVAEAVEIAPNIKRYESPNSIVAEIHEAFYTEVDKLLKSAKVSHAIETDKQDVIDKSKRLVNLGFRRTLDIRDAEVEQQRIRNLEAENRSKKELIKTINYFSEHYPYYKFITEESVKKLCKKYGLIYGSVSKYIGTVPEENLKQIEDFKINERDSCCRLTRTLQGHTMTDIVISFVDMKAHEQQMKNEEKNNHYLTLDRVRNHVEKLPLEIVAPVKDFNLDNSEIKDFEITEKQVPIPDPIVLQPVFYNNQKHYLIVTAWGDEASDPLVVNEKNN